MTDTTEPDDATLLRRFHATRDETAFTRLVRRHLPLVYHVARRRLGSHALAEEAAQNTFAVLAAKAKQVARHPERLRAWLHRTAHLEACALARKETRLARVPVDPKPTTATMPRPEIYDRLDEALDRLPELDRELVLRHCCEDEEYRQIAAAVGKSAAACQKRVERALALLARRLGAGRSAGAVAAALAISQSRSEALPAAERIAAAALQQSSLAGGATGAAIGMKTAACAALALAGGLSGWQPQESPPESSTPMRQTMSAARSQMRQTSAATIPVLAPRPPRIDRPLDEILETIQAGRFAPLVEFLPRASPADLRAIIAEDDIYEYGEIDGKEAFGTARHLALLRWAEIDPHGAFSYTKMRSGRRWRATSPAATRGACSS